MSGLGWRDLGDLLTFSLRDPRQAAVTVIGMMPDRRTRRLALVVVAILTSLQIYLSIPMLPMEMQMALRAADPSPVLVAAIGAGMIWLTGVATHRIGRYFGGTGSAEASQWVVIWTAFVRVCLLAVILVLYYVAPMLAGLADLAALVLSLYVFAGFVCTLHGFKSVWKVAGATVAVALLAGFFANLVLFALIQGVAVGS